ncbi:voltage-dependent calcium channel subunit alpha-2/delta-3 isoform X1 [Dendroctonus ponderosae]|uniref:voltage-dependent calcium channel subunit alpha-2/delta-3 isoform X1 n=1 Tax=Dendroctonus ponderosae TaxID=77166 RepID=UPI0020360CD9|nr:voltage-dependent calcium channel subunit alpha-2/delta-3 isoform X1 [Dendroctonus ponderosae]
MVLLAIILLALVGPAALEQDEDIPHNEVRNWALQFGVGLWEYGKMMTKMNELKRKYREVETSVKRKDGLILIREMANEVRNMMDFKRSAVMRIMDSAEQAALAWRSDNNGVTPRYYNAERLNAFAPDGRPADGTRELVLTPNPHFDHLPVNVTFSTVLTPSRVYDTDPEVGGSIQWSAHLDPLFVSNYEGDPTLSWQFFGSSTGFLRRYPGISWPPEDLSTVQDSHTVRRPYDFRSAAWYVGAATSPKDIAILLDASGSMAGHRANLARATVESILDTLTDNDFVNIFRFSDTTSETLPCFKDQLVQATQENLRWLKDSLGTIKQENIANFSSALVAGFEILHKYNRTGQGCQCNQALMLITDGPPSSYKDIFKLYNFPHRPVRLFTYLIGSDSGSAAEMHWMACENKGYYTKIENYDEIKNRVFHYIEVMARPMVMYQNNHPIHWTSAYVGGRADSFSDDKVGQLMTTVTAPVFDRRNHTVRLANLLGVVGTDVSIDEIRKLVPPYKLGANGYSFIVNNNGHILYHPNLKPPRVSEKYEQTLEPQYLSVDLSEVELVENENGPRENHSALLDLRQDMINQKEGETELTLKVHYDDMRRVTTRRYKYFYNAIEGTPFSLGLAIPEGYGMFELLAEQEIKHSQKNVTDYLKGNKWRVHPDWVYCEYTSGTSGEQWFKTAEERVLHFLSRSRRPGWKWMSLRPRASPQQREREHHHYSTKQEKDSYYCDKTLTQSLVLDAMVTESLEKHRPRMEDKHPIGTLLVQLQSQGYDIFGSTTWFVATRSGLLRWSNFTNTDNDDPPFGQNNARAIDESWYQRAVDQHAIEPESFVFSVPFAEGPPGSPVPERTLLTATHAVFIESSSHRAPAAVVGLQYVQSSIASHFQNITSKCTSTCKKTCASNTLDCYVLDNNGFIIISENNEHTGRFFGQIDGTIMDSLVQDRIYKKVSVYDYQGYCSNSKYSFSGRATNLKSTGVINLLLKFTIQTLAVLISHLQTAYGTALAYSQEDEEEPINYEYEYPIGDDLLSEQHPMPAPPVGFVPPFESDPLEGVDLGQWGTRPCDRKVELYVLQPERLNTSGQNNPLKGKLTNCHVTGCERPFSVQKIPHSNLILLVVDTLCPCGSKQLSITPQELAYESRDQNGCTHRPRPTLYRKRPPKCINYHPEEIEIHICGKGTALKSAQFLTLLFCVVICLLSSDPVS